MHRHVLKSHLSNRQQPLPAETGLGAAAVTLKGPFSFLLCTLHLVWKLSHKEDDLCLRCSWTGWFRSPVWPGQPEELTQRVQHFWGQQEASKSMRPWKRLGTQRTAHSAGLCFSTGICETPGVSVSRAGKGRWEEAWSILSQVACAYLQPSSQNIPEHPWHWFESGKHWHPCCRKVLLSLASGGVCEWVALQTEYLTAHRKSRGCSPGQDEGCGPAVFTGDQSRLWDVRDI